MTKFGVVFLGLLAASAVLGLARGGIAERAGAYPALARNERLTALAGSSVYMLLVAIVATVWDISTSLSAHYLVGFLLIPPVILKLGSSGYRFVSYYAGSGPYRLADAPPPLMRFVVAPVLVASTIGVLVTGVELWLFGLRFGSGWMPAHAISAVAMLLAVAPHLVAHIRRSAGVLRSDVVASTREVLSGRSLVIASLLIGAALAAASAFYPSPFPPSAAGG